MNIRKNIFIIVITIVLYISNQFIKNKLQTDILQWFMTCYFNDIIGSITFVAYCNVMLGFCRRKIIMLWHIELLMLFCGVFWEYITPIFRKNTTSDVFDILAYMLGGFIYWLIAKNQPNR